MGAHQGSQGRHHAQGHHLTLASGRRSARPLPARGPADAPLAAEGRPTGDFDYACDLFDAGFPRDAHEEWEVEWRTLPRESADALFLKGLLCVSAFVVKQAERSPGAPRLLARAEAAFARSPVARGIDGRAVVAAMQEWSRHPERPCPTLGPPPSALRPVATPSGVSPFAPPTSPTPAFGPSTREVLTFFLVRVFVLVVGPVMFGLVPSLLGLRSRTAFAVGVAVGVAAWTPTSLLLFRLLFFPDPPDGGLQDAMGRPVSARDLRAGLFARATEHLLGTAPLLLLLPYAWRAFEPALATILSAVVLGWVGWRELRYTGAVLVEDAEILLHTGLVRDALARVTFARRWFPRTGDAGALVLARARFRVGDARGAVEALDQIRDRTGYHADLLRAQMGVAFLPRDEVESARATAEQHADTSGVADILRALVLLHDGSEVPADLVGRLASGEQDGRGLPLLLAACAAASTEPERARALLEGWERDPAEVAALGLAWPAVGVALARLRP